MSETVKIDHRQIRAEQFAATVMSVVGPYVQRKNECRDAIVRMAYAADVEIISHRDEG